MAVHVTECRERGLTHPLSERADLLAAVRAYTDAAVNDWAGGAAGAESLAALGRLLAQVGDLFDDVEAAVASGQLHLRRAAAWETDEDAAQAELRTAAWYFLSVIAEGVGDPPRAVIDFYARAAVSDVPGAGPPTAPGLSLRACHDRVVTAMKRHGAGSRGGAALRPALFVLRHLAATSTTGTEQRVAWLSNLSAALLTLYRQEGEAGLLDEAVAAAREAVCTTETVATSTSHDGGTGTDAATGTAVQDGSSAAPSDHDLMEHDLADRLMNLSGALQARYGRTGSPEDLRDALDAGRKAASLDSAPVQSRARNLSNLSLALLSHFERTDDEEALVEAASHARQAVALVPEGSETALLLTNLSAVLGSLGSRNTDADMLQEAVDAARRAVLLGGDALEGPEDFVLPLAQALFDLYETTYDTAVLGECAAVCRAVLDSLPAHHPERYRYLLSLGRTLRAQAHSAAGDATVLSGAVDTLREAAAATSPGSPGRADTLGNLMLALQDVYDGTSDPRALDEAIDTGRLAAEAAAQGDPALLKIQGNLANSLLDRYRRAGDMTDLDEAVEIGYRAVAATPPGHRDEASHLTSLAHQLLVRYQATGDPSALTESIAAARRAVDRASADGATALAAPSNLSVALATLFERTGSLEALHEAVALRRETVRATPVGSPALAGRLSNLTGVLRMVYDHTGSRAALEEAADCARRLMSTLTPGQAEYPLRMANTATTLHQWSEVAHDNEAGEEAVTAAGLAVDALPDTHTARPALLSNHCGILLARYRRTGVLAKLTDAWNAARAAVRSAHPDDPDRPLYLLNLAMASRSRHERTGDPDVLREGMGAAEEALSLAPAGHPLRPQLLSQMSLGLQARYQRSGELRHLTESAKAAREAVLSCQSDHPDHAMYQSNLSAALQILHQRQDPPDAAHTIAEAVTAARAAVVVTEFGDPDLPALLSHLCGALMFQYAFTGSLRELAAAVTAGRRAVALSPPGHPDQTHRLANLTAAWRLRYRHDASPRALRVAVATARRAVVSLASDHPDEASVLTGCAAALRTAYRAGAGRAELEEALHLLHRAAHSTVSPVGDRLRAARALGRAALEADETGRALKAYESAVDLLGQLAPWRLSRTDREFGLGEMEGLGSEAAGAALSCGDPGRAVELLEQARGVMLNQSLEMRGDVDELRATCPDLADEFEALRARRDAADHISLAEQFGETSGAQDNGSDDAVRRIAAERTAMDSEWHALLSRIRSLPRLEGFLGRPDRETLRRQAKHGFVIMLAVSRHRGDALVLTSDPHSPVIVVGLPEVTENRVIEWADRLLGGRVPGFPPVTDYARAKRRMRDLVELLEWQWDHVAGPVLERIGLTRSHRPDEDHGEWPRIWWCPAGVTAFLPWHASGHHQEGGARGGTARTVMDRAVSSWTPTVRALAHARRLPGAATSRSGQDALLVEMAQPAGTIRPLRHVETETEHIVGLLPDATLIGPPHNTPRTVLDALPAHPVVHFACHAVSEWGSPRRSGLLLSAREGYGDGGGSGTARLTVDAISSRHIAGADLAYLSACSTSLTNQRLADESVHITAGFMLCGYRHVIGTLWPVDDTAAGEIAVDFYTRLAGDDGAGLRTENAAHALHLSLHQGRAKRPWAPSLWAAHLHTGA
ncbi:CHAT domain-containing protein [Streptomyces anthocyanicus]|uniref:CHAT domain-containing tetratricopeptide repeat protein n=1 Tax=Streptomyces anthocyanicus TaxID=68174 RepID=UPI003369D349